MSDKKPEPTLVEVTLAKRHTHAGTDYKAGDTIDVTEPERAWLMQHKVLRADDPARTATTTAPKVQTTTTHDTPMAQEGAK